LSLGAAVAAIANILGGLQGRAGGSAKGAELLFLVMNDPYMGPDDPR